MYKVLWQSSKAGLSQTYYYCLWFCHPACQKATFTMFVFTHNISRMSFCRGKDISPLIFQMFPPFFVFFFIFQRFFCLNQESKDREYHLLYKLQSPYGQLWHCPTNLTMKMLHNGTALKINRGIFGTSRQGRNPAPVIWLLWLRSG